MDLFINISSTTDGDGSNLARVNRKHINGVKDGFWHVKLSLSWLTIALFKKDCLFMIICSTVSNNIFFLQYISESNTAHTMAKPSQMCD